MVVSFPRTLSWVHRQDKPVPRGQNHGLAPHRLVKDLRTGVENGKPDAALDGGLDKFMAAALAARAGATRSEASAQAR
jgi:peptide chain release factor 2